MFKIRNNCWLLFLLCLPLTGCGVLYYGQMGLSIVIAAVVLCAIYIMVDESAPLWVSSKVGRHKDVGTSPWHTLDLRPQLQHPIRGVASALWDLGSG